MATRAVHLKARNDNPDDLAHYDYTLEADYADPGSEYAFLNESEFIHPHLVFTKQADTDEGFTSTAYFLEVFDLTTPRYIVKKRIREYVEYLASDEWDKAQYEYADLPDEPPIILIACSTLAQMIYEKRYARRQFADIWGDMVPEDVKMRVSTIEKIKAKGLTSIIWKDV